MPACIARHGRLIPALLVCCLVILAACGEDAPAHPAGSSRPRMLFRDVTDEVGITFKHENGATGKRYLPETMGGGGCVLDIDGDGWQDVYLVQSGDIPGAAGKGLDGRNVMYRNRGDGTFEDVTAASGTGHPGYGMGAVAADYDGDGDDDIYITNFGPNVLYRNDGNGRFTDVTAEAGVGDPLWSCSAVFFDADQDGDLDLYVVNYVLFTVARHKDCVDTQVGVSSYCHPDVYPPAPDTYYENKGDGTFEKKTRAAGLEDTTGKGLGVVTLDYDGDGLTDVYVANDSTPNFLYRNLGGGRFEEVGLFAGVSHNERGLTEAGMGTDAADVNGDGWMDIIVTNLSGETNALYLGGPDGFRYATPAAGLHVPTLLVLGFAVDFLDVDNDGDFDIFVGNGDVRDNIALFNDSIAYEQPGQVFLNDGRAHFELMEPTLAGDVSIPRVARGSITFDPDRDGRQDILVIYNNQRARLYRNVWPESGHWIRFELIPRRGAAVATRVRVRTGETTLMDEVKAGSSYLASGDKRLHFGLGQATRAEEVTIRWPDGSRETFRDLPADRDHVIRQGRASKEGEAAGSPAGTPKVTQRERR